MKIINKYNKRGFTLVEIIAVLFVVVVGLMGVLSLIVQNIQSQSLNKNNLTAYQLAQEGMELVRKVRDSNWRNSNVWDKDLVAGSYYMDYSDSTPHILSASTEGDLYKNSSGFYVHGGATETPFNRTIEIALIDADSMRVYIHITWSDHGRVFNYDLETILYDWH